MFGEQKDLAFNLTLEILQGCGYSCQDCAIDQRTTSDFVRQGDPVALIDLAQAMKQQGYRLHELTLGPTDIIASRSGLKTLEDPLVWGLAGLYDSLTVSLALLYDRGLVELADGINRLMAGKKFRLIVPMTLKNAGNLKYLEQIRRRIEILKSHLVDVEFKLVYLNINMVNHSSRNFSPETHQVAREVDMGVETLVEYAFPHGRRDFKNLLVQSEFQRDLSAFTQGIQACNNTRFNRYLIPTLSDSLEFTYHQGDLYYTPVLMEKFPLFIPELKMVRPWTTESLIDWKTEQYIAHLNHYSTHPVCGDCCFLGNCSEGDTHLLMDIVQPNHCPLHMKNRWDLNPSTDPVRSDD